MNTYKRFVGLVVSISLSCSILILSGCWDRRELNDLALISALAFDKAEKNQIQVTAQFIIPLQQSGGGGGGGGGGSEQGGKTTIRTEKGANITDALSKLQSKMTRKQFWGVCNILIFSEKFAETDMRKSLDLLVRHPHLRERAYIFISKGKAADVLELSSPIENTSAEVLKKLSDLQIGMRVNLEDLSQMFVGEAQSAAIPLVYILPRAKSEKPFQTIPYIYGVAVFHQDKKVGTLSEKSTRGILWVTNKIKEYTITFKVNGALITLQPVKSKVKLIPKISGEQWMMTIKVETEGDIVENNTKLDPMNPDVLIKMDKAFEDDIRSRIELSLHDVQQRLKTDIVQFGKEFHRKYPKQWEQSKDNWDEIFPEVKVNFEIKAKILRTGLINSPGGYQLEVKKN